MIRRVKIFVQRFQEIARIVSKLSQLVGDGIDVIKVVDSVVDSFIEQRKNGKLKDVDFYDFASAVCDLISKIAESGEPLADVVNNILALFESMGKLDSTNLVETISNNGPYRNSL